jgi:GTPase SAR1 family protein
VVIVYDVTNADSYERAKFLLQRWSEALEWSVRVLVGNKVDLLDGPDAQPRAVDLVRPDEEGRHLNVCASGVSDVVCRNPSPSEVALA